jgi:hypothetical protein
MTTVDIRPDCTGTYAPASIRCGAAEELRTRGGACAALRRPTETRDQTEAYGRPAVPGTKP